MLVGHVSSTPHVGLPFMAVLVVAGSLAYPADAADTAESPEPIGVGTAASESDDPVVLPALVVSGSRYRTETTAGYTSDLISVGEKEALPPREVPQSTTVLTRDYLEDRGARSMDTALREAPGILVLNNENGRSSILARGFEFDSLYLNGLPAPELSIYGTQPDMAIVDHIEILKGPAGLFGGAGEPAGAINMSLKQPVRTFQGYAALTGDTWAGFRAEGDVSTPFNESGTLRGRLVLAQDDQESWIEDSENTTRLAYGTVQADLTEQTTASITVSHAERDILPNNGLPTFANGDLVDVDRSTTTAADWNRFDNFITDYIGELEHRFDDGGHAKISARYADRWVDFLYAFAGGPADETGQVSSMRWLARKLDQTSLALDAHVTKPFTLLGQDHNVLVGADYQRMVDTLSSEVGRIATANNIYNWNTDIPEPTVTYTSRTETTVNQYGVYGQVRIRPVSALTLIGGGRMTWYDSEVIDLNTSDTVATIDLNGEFTPYAGVVLDVTPELSAYASYTAIFQPQSQVDVNDQPLDPRQGEQYEIGLKGGFFDESLNVSGALFLIRDKNRALQNEDGNYEAREEVESRGIELEASGEVLPGWDVLAGYTYTETKYTNGMNEGSTFSAVTPKHMAHVWTTYRFSGNSMLDGLTVGGGVKAFSDFSSVNRGVEINADGYTVVDLMARYDLTENLSTTLSVNNVFDTKYYERVGGTSVFNFYGQPLSAMLSVKASF
ncbi:TonB-dependent siderophore receptor [Roseospira visakhapatnamensis]|uniref:Outer membrane receptor for ferric coprogen and ferric-rhodotorulic acid n=1 Tax=Roseospira visakhapatnamensis TaxID=390880 RepID=A0A7W6WBQ0_9PROT|nr:TonB-dependent siderophore receptor [Roseospira visakhapatnamensis]MBB4267767.1 outer membrane receptor for ferric coprogen and ferric-rhodotorulic acid [Roseospira visakhapatnamensis]